MERRGKDSGGIATGRPAAEGGAVLAAHRPPASGRGPGGGGDLVAVSDVLGKAGLFDGVAEVLHDLTACAVGETSVILLHPPSTSSRCFNRDGGSASAK